MTVHPFDVRGLKMPFPSHEPNPARKGADENMWAFIDKHDICPAAVDRKRMRATESVLCMALYHPRADAHRFQVLCQWLGWAYITDDTTDNPPASREPRTAADVILPMTAVLDGRPATTPLARALADVHATIIAGRSTGWQTEFILATKRWLWAAYAHSVYSAAQQTPTVTGYLASIHGDTSGYPMALALCEYADGVDLPETVRKLPAWITMHRAAADYMGLVNDLHSAHYEGPDGWLFNTALLMAAEHRTDMGSAIRDTVSLANGRLDAFCEARNSLEAQLRVTQDDTSCALALRVADSYADMMRGNLDWHTRADRYT
jgi:(+)-beta-caryophyllene/(+)-caryolan-1-ol synthase